MHSVVNDKVYQHTSSFSFAYCKNVINPTFDNVVSWNCLHKTERVVSNGAPGDLLPGGGQFESVTRHPVFLIRLLTTSFNILITEAKHNFKAPPLLVLILHKIHSTKAAHFISWWISIKFRICGLYSIFWPCTLRNIYYDRFNVVHNSIEHSKTILHFTATCFGQCCPYSADGERLAEICRNKF